MNGGPTISTHVLDVGGGAPGVGYQVALYRLDGDAEIGVGHGETDADGRIRKLLEGPLVPGDYRIDIDVDAVFMRRASITFRVDDITRSYHVPFLVSPFSLTTYRGS
jgi:5-hydroxyisourate hydrolase